MAKATVLRHPLGTTCASFRIALGYQPSGACPVTDLDLEKTRLSAMSNT